VLAFPGSIAVSKGGEHGDDALQACVDVRMARRVATRLRQRFTEVILDDRGQAGLGLHGRCEGGAISPGCRLSVSA
jgi:hypothetical protein